MKFEQIHSVQDWMQIQNILEKGIIKLKDISYIKIIKVKPINYNLKTELEKESILNSYKKMFLNCNFNLQVLIQSKKEDLSNHILKLEKESEFTDISNKYVEYIKKLNLISKSSSKNFYIIIKEFPNQNEEIIIEKLQEKYFKLKDGLARCGNILSEITNENEAKEIIISILNQKI